MRFSARHLASIYFLSASTLLACSVPVFRYALEHWAADPFQVLVYHRGPLSDAGLAALEAVEKREDAQPNARIRLVDVDDDATPADLKQLFAAQKNAELPWVMARFPTATGIKAPFYSSSYSPEALSALLHSPARAELARRLASGESAVWLLVEGADPEENDAAEKLLRGQLEYLASVMKLPKLDDADIANGLVSVSEEALRLEFSLLRIARDDPAEQVLTRMLLVSEEGLEEADEPIAFPIFGRGRALYALVGAGICPEMIESAAAFLVGKCSCQVKEQNPGVDLLVAADWAAAARTAPPTQKPESQPGFQLDSRTIEATSTSTPTSSSWALALGVLICATLGWYLLKP